MKLNNITSSLLITIIVILTLIYAQSIIIPFVVAILIWFLVKKMRNLIDKITFIKKYIPGWIKTVLASFLLFSLLFLVGQMLTRNIEYLALSYDQYASNIEIIALKINEAFKINVHEQITDFMNEFEFQDYLTSLINSISELLGSMVMIIFYAIFLFIEESLFERKIRLIFSEEKGHKGFNETLHKIDKSMSSYVSLKSMISLTTTTLSYFVLVAVGIDSPMFWAFLIFMLNFIPSVGPIIGTILPALFSLIQFGQFLPFFVILLGVGTIALLVGSLVEPRLMGNTLNISPLVAILSLAIWGAMWGIIGMFLSVPLTVGLIIVFSQFENTRSIAILLSEKGRV